MLTNYLRTLRMFNRNVRLYLLATGLLGFAIDGGVFTVIFNLYLLRLGFGPEFIGQVNSAALLVFALAALPAGGLGSWLGIRRMMVLGLGLMVGGSAGLPAAELLPGAWTGVGILAGFVTVYAGMALYFVNAVPFVMAITTPEERAHAFSMQSALLSLAAFSGAMIGGFLPRVYAALWAIDQQQPGPYRFPLIFAAAVMTPGLWALLRIPLKEAILPSQPAAGSAVAPARRWQLEGPLLLMIGLLSVVRFFQVAGVATTSTFFNVYMDTALAVPTAQIGMLAAVARLLAVPAALLTPVLTARWGAPRTVVAASAATAVCLLPLALAPHWAAAGLGYMGVTAFSSLRYPAYLVYSMELVPTSWRATLAGAGEMAGGLCFALMALAGGYLIEARGFMPLFLLGASGSLLGTVLFHFWFAAPRAKHAPAPVG